MPRIALKRHHLGAVVGLVLLGAPGCSPGEKTAPETIEGKTPADYREAAEQSLANPVPDTPKAAPAKGGRQSR